ncbi:unnamed protein product [Gordionus sp. m RMFG-2023]
MYCHDNTIENCNMIVNTGHFQTTKNLRINKSGEVEEVNWINAENASNIHLSIQKVYRSPKDVSLEINNEYSKTHVQLVPLELKVEDLGEIVNISTLVAPGNQENPPVWIHEKDGLKKEMNGYWVGTLAMLDVEIQNETVGIYSLKDKRPEDKSFQVAKFGRFKKEIKYCDPLVFIWPAVSDYLAPNSYDPLLQVKSPDSDAKLINLTINGNVFNFSIEKCVPTGIYRVLIDEVLVAEISLDVKGEIVDIEAIDNSGHDAELDISKYNITSSDEVKVFYVKDYSLKWFILSKYVINGNRLTVTLGNLWNHPGIYNVYIPRIGLIFRINAKAIRTKKLNVDDGNKYNETFIFENGKEIEVSGTASFEDQDEVKHVDYNYEMQYLELHVRRSLHRYYDPNIKTPNIFLIKSNELHTAQVSNENIDEHDISISDIDGHLFLEIRPMIRKNISVEIRFNHGGKILIVHLDPVEMVILTNNQVSALFIEGQNNSSGYEWILPNNKSNHSIENPMNYIFISANNGFDGYIVVKQEDKFIKAWFVISLGTESVTVNMITKTATISNANRFLRQDQCFQPLGIILRNIRIKANYNCDTEILEFEVENIEDSDLYNKSYLHPLYVENHHVANIRLN